MVELNIEHLRIQPNEMVEWVSKCCKAHPYYNQETKETGCQKCKNKCTLVYNDIVWAEIGRRRKRRTKRYMKKFMKFLI